MGSAKSGSKGNDVIITVPVGTVVREIHREDPAAEEAEMRKANWNRRRAVARERERRRSIKAMEAREEGEEGEEGEADEAAAAAAAEKEAAAMEEDIADDPFRHMWLTYAGLNKSEARRLDFPRFPRRERFFAQPAAPIHLDLSRPTPRPILLAAGGIGGLGNPHFSTKDIPKPMFATRGERAMSMTIELELKLLADVGLVGLPNAGKSTLLRAISNSRARVGSWQFTTLQPNIGTVVLDNNKGRPLLNAVRPNKVIFSRIASSKPDLDFLRSDLDRFMCIERFPCDPRDAWRAAPRLVGSQLQKAHLDR